MYHGLLSYAISFARKIPHTRMMYQTLTLESFFQWRWTLLIAGTVYALIYLFHQLTRTSTPPGSLGILPMIGETFDFIGTLRKGDPHAFIRRRVKKYGSNVFKTSVLGSPTVLLGGVQGNRFVFSNENKLLTLSWPTSIRIILSNSLATTSGDDAKRLRKVFMTFLGPEALQSFVSRVDSVVRSHLHTHWNGKSDTKVVPLMKKLTFSIACRLFISEDDESKQEELASPFGDFVRGVFALPFNLPGTTFRKAIRGRDRIYGILNRVVCKRREQLRSGDVSATQDILSYLVCYRDEDGRMMSDEEIKGNILLLLFAGHDTSSCALTMLIKLLAENPTCYEKVLREQMEIASTKSSDDEPLQWQDLQKMEYTWKAIQETLRLHPPVVGGFREVLTEFKYQGFTIPKGWKVFWSTYWTHRSEEYFKDVGKFDIEREVVEPYTFVAFGGGARICPGADFARMEMLVFLHYLVRQFKWELLDPFESITADPMPRPLNNLPINLFHI